MEQRCGVVTVTPWQINSETVPTPGSIFTHEYTFLISICFIEQMKWDIYFLMWPKYWALERCLTFRHRASSI